MSTHVNPHLFVYGSLMSRSGHAMGERLRREARLICEATIGGQLYRISWYPGLVESHDAGEQVHGEVYALQAPARALAWLDAYEGLTPGNADAGDYARVERPVRLATGEEISAWVYLYRKDASKLSRIPQGRWTARAR